MSSWCSVIFGRAFLRDDDDAADAVDTGTDVGAVETVDVAAASPAGFPNDDDNAWTVEDVGPRPCETTVAAPPVCG
jgi:hypothetical protein